MVVSATVAQSVYQVIPGRSYPLRQQQEPNPAPCIPCICRRIPELPAAALQHICYKLFATYQDPDLSFLDFVARLLPLQLVSKFFRAAVDQYLVSTYPDPPLWAGPNGTIHPAADHSLGSQEAQQQVAATLQRIWPLPVHQAGRRRKDGRATGLTAADLDLLADQQPDLVVLRANLITHYPDCAQLTAALQRFKKLQTAELVWCIEEMDEDTQFDFESHLRPIVRDMPSLVELHCTAPLPSRYHLAGQRAALSVGVQDCPRLRHITLGGSNIYTYRTGSRGRLKQPHCYWAGPQGPDFGKGCPAAESFSMDCCNPHLLLEMDWPFAEEVFTPRKWSIGTFGLLTNEREDERIVYLVRQLLLQARGNPAGNPCAEEFVLLSEGSWCPSLRMALDILKFDDMIQEQPADLTPVVCGAEIKAAEGRWDPGADEEEAVQFLYNAHQLGFLPHPVDL